MADQQDFLQPGYWRNASRPLNVYGIPAPLFLLLDGRALPKTYSTSSVWNGPQSSHWA